MTVQHRVGDGCEPFTCSHCGGRYAHYDTPPILAWPKYDADTADLVSEAGLDVPLYRICVECTPALRFKA